MLDFGILAGGTYGRCAEMPSAAATATAVGRQLFSGIS